MAYNRSTYLAACASGGTLDRDGKASWSDTGYLTAAGGGYATCSVGKSTYSAWLLATNFAAKLALPSEALVEGVEVVIHKYGGSSNLIDSVVSLNYQGQQIGANQASSSIWPTGASPSTYGGSSNLWSMDQGSLSSIINDASFGVRLSVANNKSNGSVTAYVDAVQLKVYYRLACVASVVETTQFAEVLNYLHEVGFILAGDGVGLGEARNTVLTGASTGTDRVYGGEARSALGSLGATSADAVKTADSSIGSLVLGMLTADSVKLAEPVQQALIIGLNAVVDTITKAEARANQLITSRQASDGLRAGEAPGQTLSVYRLVADGLFGAEAQTALAAMTAQAADAAISNDTVFFGNAFILAVQDGLSVLEAVSSVAALVGYGADTVSNGEGLSSSWDGSIGCAESLGCDESSSGGFVLNIAAGDVLLSGELLPDSVLLALNTCLDGVKGSEAQTGLIQGVAAALDGLKGADARSAAVNMLRGATDGLFAQEVFTSNAGLAAALSEILVSGGPRKHGNPGVHWKWVDTE